MRPAASLALALALAPAAAAAAYDFTRFETDVVPAWLARFAIDFDAGIFSYKCNSSTPDLF
eukprot:gene28593-48885_t